VAESFAPGGSVSKVAQRYGVNANLLFTWRRQQGRANAVGGQEPIELLPVMVADAGSAASPVAAANLLLPRRCRSTSPLIHLIYPWPRLGSESLACSFTRAASPLRNPEGAQK
jgi:Transposase